MIKKSKKSLLVLLSSILSFSCNISNIQESSKDKVFKTLSTPEPTQSLDPNFVKIMPSVQNMDSITQVNLEEIKEKDLDLDFETPPSDSGEIIEGSISIIFRNEYKVRSKNKKSVYSKSLKSIDELNKILTENGVIGISSLEGNYTEESLEESHKKTKKFYGEKSDIPDIGSLYTFIFPKEIDTRKLSKELRKLTYVRTAYPTLKINTSGVGTSVGTKQTPSNYSYSPLPNDQFGTYPESTRWWYFNRHKIFQAQALFGNTDKPVIAVLDEGFDIQSYAYDKPNYIAGYSVTCPVANSTCNYLYNDLLEPSIGNTSTSHGTEVSSIIGSPKDNGSGLTGVLPNTPIKPIRLNAFSNTNPSPTSIGPTEVIAGIDRAVQEGSDVINMSLQNNANIPITYDTSIRAAVANAIASGTIVVICAGNGTNKVIDTLPDNPNQGIYYIPDVGEIIVGGTKNDTTTGASSAYNSGGYTGSAYGSRIDLAAGAVNIFAATYESGYPNDPSKRKYTNIEGTSFATPMVATVAGMVKKIAQASNLSLTPIQVRQILTYSGNLTRYTAGYSSSSESKFIGRNLNSSNNQNLKVGIRELNAYNALLIAKYINQTNAMTRVSNVDDVAWSAINDINYKYGNDAYGYDSLYKLSSMNSSDVLKFQTYNFSGGHTYGYQYFKRNPTTSSISIYEKFGGVKGVVGTTTSSASNSWVNSSSMNY